MFSIIIPNLHSPLIGNVIAALRQQSRPELINEIIVVGQDRHRLITSDRLVRHDDPQRPLSAAAARNRGFHQARSEWLLFIDADCIAQPTLVETFSQAITHHDIVGGSVEMEATPYWTVCDNLLTFTSTLDTAPAGPRDYLPSLNFCIKRTLLQQVNGFDPRFPGAAGEDIDLSLRLRRAGQTLWFEPQARLYHRPTRATAGSVAQHLRAFGRAQVRLARSYPDLLASRLSGNIRKLAPALQVAAPLLACNDIVSLFATRQLKAHFLHCLPGLVWGKTAWYWGASEALLVGND
jgi:cellulose synthase/poly-beta-1,6-N-acetylglucosamine synthase-like glycosyltransferase